MTFNTNAQELHCCTRKAATHLLLDAAATLISSTLTGDGHDGPAAIPLLMCRLDLFGHVLTCSDACAQGLPARDCTRFEKDGGRERAASDLPLRERWLSALSCNGLLH